MTKANYTHIVCILDRSGSMDHLRDDAIGGFNKFLEDQKKLADEATISLVQFDDQYEPNYEFVAVKDAKPLTHETYLPRGWTALNDAVGRTIIDTGKRLEAMAESQRPGKVLVLIITDGQENSSKRFSRQQIHRMITEQQDKYKWEFIFIGAGIDAFSEAASLGIKANYAAQEEHTKGGIIRSMSLCSEVATSYRARGTKGIDAVMNKRNKKDDPQG